MRQVFIACKYRYQAVKKCDWAAIIVKVFGGYHAFESVDDYKTWKQQK